MENLPKLTVIMAVRNAVGTVARALDSIAAQRYPNLELIVWDGFSQDGTLEALKKYSSLITILRSEVDNGPPDAHNKALALATGDYVALFAGDDEYEPGTFWAVADAIMQNPGTDMVTFGMLLSTYDEKGRAYVRGYYADESQLKLNLKQVLSENPTFVASRFFKKSIFTDVGNFTLDKTFCYYASDREWMTRLALKRLSNVVIPKALYSFRIHRRSMSNTPGHFSSIIQEHMRIAQALMARPELDEFQKKLVLQWQRRQLVFGFWFALAKFRIDEAESFLKQGLMLGKLNFIFLTLGVLVTKSIKKLAYHVYGGIDRGIIFS